METIGKYRVVRELGKGATATVYLCEDSEHHRQVAIKLVRFGADANAMSRRLKKLFQTEGGIARRLDHPNIVAVYEGVVEDTFAYLAMEYVEGFALDQYTRIDRLLPLNRVIGIIFKCCLALDHAYHQGVIHRDIKPANIMVMAGDEPKIADFGLALNISKDIDRDSTFIMGVGSPAYMSPEQIKGYPLNQKTDLYSLGVVLFQLLTGRLPFRANNQATLIYKIINTDPPLLTGINPNLPEGLNAILRKALEKDLYNRYKNGAEFAKDLAAVRYQILTEDETEQDEERFETLRKLEFFTEFENIELWEILRVSVWRELAAGVTIIEEGQENRVFGLLVRGLAEVSVAGRLLCRLEAGEVIGEVTYLHPTDCRRHATVVTLEPSLFLELNASALELASDELRERMNKALTAKMITRMRAANQIAASLGAPVRRSGTASAPDKVNAPGDLGGGLDLAPM
ncbi:MAG: Serine/threonine-protein kinase PrkC [Betaproteobacteria bacterium ADurb.Bin341]|nr:MAG: Serine/threonine-protein kinase PrkC [Betaproteobacteria bacterium ADurb.Bin341]